VPDPVIGDGDVLVRILASGVDPLDGKIMAGEFKLILPYRTPFVLGNDLAGVVVQVGRSVRRFAPGDEVYARPDKDHIGTSAELIAVDEGDLARAGRADDGRGRGAPAGRAHGVAGVGREGGRSSWSERPRPRRLRRGGTIAIQLAKHLGAHVATTASTANVDWVRKLGADEVIDYRTATFEQELRDFDVVLDSLWPENLAKSLRVLRPGGLAISIAGPPDPAFPARLGRPLLRPVLAVLSRRVRRAARKLDVRYSFLFMRADGGRLQQITALVEAGVIRPVLDRTFDFDETPAALDYVGSGWVKGKLVVTMTAVLEARS
jgi:NADPH:quinone reductase-like Zn-dependent oxidoreductase